MTITTSTQFDKVRLYALDSTDGPDEIVRIEVRRVGQFVDKLSPRQGTHRYGWDTTGVSFGIVRDAIADGSATFEYFDRQRVVHQAADLPERLRWMEDANIVKREVDREQAEDNETVGPGVLVVYQASENQPSDEPPAFDATNDTVAKWLRAIDDAGLSYITPPTATSPEVVWSNKASYLRDGSIITSDWAGWTTAARRYSIDNGLSWTLTPPHSADQITHIQTFNTNTNAWETEPVEPKFQAAAGVGTALVNRSIEPFGAGDRYIQANSLLPAEINTRGIQAGNTTEIGIRLFVRTEWRGEPILRGLVWIPYDAIPLTRPHEVDEDDELVGLPNRNMLIKMDQGGGMSWGIVNSLSRLTDYHAGQPRFLCHWRSNPDVTLQRAIAEADLTIRIKEKPNQINAGDALYVTGGGEAENMHVQSVNRTQQGSGDNAYYILTVSRHPVGSSVNPPHAFPVDGTRILAHQATLQHSALVITAKGDLHAASSMRLWAKEDQ